MAKKIKTQSLILYRYSGTGNKFVLFDLREVNQRILFNMKYHRKSRATIARQLCKKYRTTGGDGLVILENASRVDLAWDFYNADGSKAEMCGNAARCVGLHLTHRKKTKKVYRLKTCSGIVDISVYSGNNFSVTMPNVKNRKWKQTLKIAKHEVNYDSLNTGVPHIALQVKKWTPNIKSLRLAKLLQKHSRFKPASTNVTFWEHKRLQTIRAATYERGVPNYTLACGTGAVAAASCFAKHHLVKSPFVTVLMPGGRLQVDLRKKRPILIGPAKSFAKIHL